MYFGFPEIPHPPAPRIPQVRPMHDRLTLALAVAAQPHNIIRSSSKMPLSLPRTTSTSAWHSSPSRVPRNSLASLPLLSSYSPSAPNNDSSQICSRRPITLYRPRPELLHRFHRRDQQQRRHPLAAITPFISIQQNYACDLLVFAKASSCPSARGTPSSSRTRIMSRMCVRFCSSLLPAALLLGLAAGFLFWARF
ncbi:hypothetical protein C8R45DRAFT_1008391 [Mycena sanguinolenta]|nr:hypothetical protein C8R45DRAFT_1008391 [Mycena sanguinolenta]